MLLLILLPALAAALELTPPENAWVRVGQTNVTMMCKASEKIRSCSWTTPYGKVYPLQSGLMAESGRLQGLGSAGEKQCGVLLTAVQGRDEGRWVCNVGVVDENSEVTTASGRANLSLASPPSSLSLAGLFSSPTTNLSTSSHYKVSCLALEARPKPTFSWLLDGEALAGTTMDEEVMLDTSGLSTFSQHLTYYPAQWHDNKTLACVVSHPGATATIRAETQILLTGIAVSTATLPLAAVIGIVVLLVAVILVGIVGVIFKRRMTKSETLEKTDAEMAVENEADKTSKTESAHEEEKVAEEEEEEGRKKPKIQTQITAFFNGLKTKQVKKLDETAASEWEKVELTDEEEKEVVEEKEMKQGMVATFLARFKTEKKEMLPEEKEVEKKDEEKEEEKNDEEKKEEGEEKEGEDKPSRRGSETPV